MFENKIFEIDDSNFDRLALSLFRWQAENNQIYSKYLKLLKVDYREVGSIDRIPFMPVDFFKRHKVVSSKRKPVLEFWSSGTTQKGQRAKHHIIDIELYKRSIIKGFELFFGSPKKYNFLALLPSYMEQQNSSLIFMVKELIKVAESDDSGFFLNNKEQLYSKICRLKEKGDRKIFLIGVSYALLDFAEKYKIELEGEIVMETGGMKGRKKEMIREELHQAIKTNIKIENIQSEYGMTEILSQAYSTKNGIFRTPNWMKIIIRDLYDPFEILKNDNSSGGINIIDLANIYSCAFLQTQDIGRTKEGGFEVLGRFDNSQIRGCNLLY